MAAKTPRSQCLQIQDENEAGSLQPNDASFLHAPKDLICDAFGKCKEKISGAMGKAKDISETVNEALDKPRKEVGEARLLRRHVVC